MNCQRLRECINFPIQKIFPSEHPRPVKPLSLLEKIIGSLVFGILALLPAGFFILKSLSLRIKNTPPLGENTAKIVEVAAHTPPLASSSLETFVEKEMNINTPPPFPSLEKDIDESPLKEDVLIEFFKNYNHPSVDLETFKSLSTPYVMQKFTTFLNDFKAIADLFLSTGEDQYSNYFSIRQNDTFTIPGRVQYFLNFLNLNVDIDSSFSFLERQSDGTFLNSEKFDPLTYVAYRNALKDLLKKMISDVQIHGDGRGNHYGFSFSIKKPS